MPYYIGTIFVEEPATGRASRHVVRAWVPPGPKAEDTYTAVAIGIVRRRIAPDGSDPPLRFDAGPVSLSKDQHSESTVPHDHA
jgi:hypothetical protein